MRDRFRALTVAGIALAAMTACQEAMDVQETTGLWVRGQSARVNGDAVPAADVHIGFVGDDCGTGDPEIGAADTRASSSGWYSTFVEGPESSGCIQLTAEAPAGSGLENAGQHLYSVSLGLPADTAQLDIEFRLPRRHAIGGLLYGDGCGWPGGKPATSPILVDVVFGIGHVGGDDGPSEADLALVRSHGGEVLYSYNIPAARIRMPTDSVPALAGELPVSNLLTVPDAAKHDLSLHIEYTAPPTAADVKFVESLDGRAVTRRFPNGPNVLIADLADERLPELWARENVAGILSQAPMCAAAGGSTAP